MMGVRQFEIIIKKIHWDANTGTLQIQYIQRARKQYKYSTRSISDAPALQIQCIQRLWLAEVSDHAANFANRYGNDGIQKTWIQKSTNFQQGFFLGQQQFGCLIKDASPRRSKMLSTGSFTRAMEANHNGSQNPRRGPKRLRNWTLGVLYL